MSQRGLIHPDSVLAGSSYVANSHVLSASAALPCRQVQQQAEAAESSGCTTMCEGKWQHGDNWLRQKAGMAIKAELMGVCP